MKKKLLAAAVVGALASPLAFAQNVTIYGGADVGYQNASGYSSGSANHNFVQSGQDFTSRLGFRGSDDVMPGMTALFVFEAGLNLDTGEQDTAGFWQRQSYVGLDSKQWGALTLGRQYTHMFNQYGTGTYSVLTAAGTLTPSGTNVRQSNYIKYSSPTFSGFTFGLGWAPGATAQGSPGVGSGGEPTTTNKDQGKYWDAQVSWRQGPIAVAFAHANTKAEAAGVKGEDKRNQLTGKWDNGTFGIYGGWAKDTLEGSLGGVSGSLDIKRYWAQPVFRFSGNDQVFGLWGRMKLDQDDSVKTTWWGVGYRHYMTKRSWVYAAWGTARNDDGAAFTPTTFATTAALGEDPRAIQLGVATTF